MLRPTLTRARSATDAEMAARTPSAVPLGGPEIQRTSPMPVAKTTMNTNSVETMSFVSSSLREERWRRSRASSALRGRRVVSTAPSIGLTRKGLERALPGRGKTSLEPDVALRPTIADVLAGRDTVLERALAEIGADAKR